MGQFGVGQSVPRTEDARLVTGHGRYTDDIHLPAETVAFFVRSPFAHANIKSIDVEEARQAPGVIAVFTHEDLDSDGVGGVPCTFQLKQKDGSGLVKPTHSALAKGRVRHVGDAVAMVVATSMEAAKDAGELVDIDYDMLPAVADTAQAVNPSAPQVHDDAPGNLCFDWDMGDKAATEKAFADAAQISQLDIINNRVVVNSMEPRGAVAEYDPAADQYTLYTSTQGSHTIRGLICNHVLNMPEEKLRVVTPDVGGGFGMKIFLYAEQMLVVWATKKVGRPVRWAGERGESFLTDTQGRDHVTHVEMATDKDGKFLGMRVSTIANLGAYLSTYGPFIPTMAGTGMLSGVYDIPAVYAEVRGVFTNTVPVDAYRGAGRPEAAYVIERIVEKVAQDLGKTRDDIRRLNFITPDQMPYRTALGETYDSGDFALHMDKAMETSDWSEMAARKADARARGKLRGIGMSYYIEACSGGGPEAAQIKMEPNGNATIMIGTQSNGQGHETAYAQLAADALGLDISQIKVKQGDTATVTTGSGTGGSRSIPVGGAAVANASEKLIVKARKIAAHAMEAADADIEHADGVYTVAGTDKSMTLQEIAKLAYQPGSLPDDMDINLDARGAYKPPAKSYPNGCHICEVEIEPDTGIVSVIKYTICDDIGVVLNPMMVTGQIHGGVAQGLGQALYEGTVYDEESGQLVSGSFMDYTVPRADHLPFVDVTLTGIPCETHPMGFKGAGEAGAIGAPPAAISAVIDALSDLGITEVDMPATPQKIWNLIQGAARPLAAE
ncbi:MAG: xanthine dehydrogenase family protein molybdopterin-binding subunit [Pseudomonadota bacterium]